MVAILGFAAALSLEFNSKVLAGNFRNISDYKSYKELCEDRNNQPKEIKRFIEYHLHPPNRFEAFNCSQSEKYVSEYVDLPGVPDLRLLRFTPNVEKFTLNDDRLITGYKNLELLKKLNTLLLSASSLDILSNVKLNNLVVLLVKIKGERLASNVNFFRTMPKLAEFSESNAIPSRGDLRGIITSLPIIPPTIYIEGENLVDISSLSSAKGVVDVTLIGPKVSNIEAIGKLRDLKVLKIFSQEIFNIDSLSGLKKLQLLAIGGGKIENLSPLSSLVNLKVLSITSNNVSDISSLASLVNIDNLNLSCNKIENVESLKFLINIDKPKASYIFLIQNAVSDISSLLPLAKNWYLDISGNKLAKVSFQKEITNLEITNREITNRMTDRKITMNDYCKGAGMPGRNKLDLFF
jgi:hypothetical protein